MSVWLTIPSKRPPEEAEPVLKLWRERGYKIALYCDAVEKKTCDLLVHRDLGYPGYAIATNWLIQQVSIKDSNAEWFVIGGDDVEPDLNHSAEEIARQCSEYFVRLNLDFNRSEEEQPLESVRTFGVMQPTGDRFADGSIDHICGSAWIGREFARRTYQGKGPLWPEYTRFFMDEELQHVAIKLGVLWQRRDLIHLHNWYGRADRSLTSSTKAAKPPDFLAHQEARWGPEKAIFEARKSQGFPGSELLP